MRKRHKGQSLVEMAFVGPILIFIFFGIIDMSYYIFAYTTIIQAARNGADKAAILPPYQSWLYNPPSTGGVTVASDDCVSTILTVVDDTAFMLPGNMRNFTTISYPTGSTTVDRRNSVDRGPIQIDINYNLNTLTPIFKLFRIGTNGTLNIHVSARRSIESFGKQPDSNGDACAKNLADWQLKHP